jgi:hypothetical protein
MYSIPHDEQCLRNAIDNKMSYPESREVAHIYVDEYVRKLPTEENFQQIVDILVSMQFTTRSYLDKCHLPFLHKLAKTGTIDLFIAYVTAELENKKITPKEVIDIINKFNIQHVPECKGSLKRDPRICSFLLHGDFQYRPIPSEKTCYESNFEEYIKDTAQCLKTEGSFALCKQNFCYVTKKIECRDDSLPKYDYFLKSTKNTVTFSDYIKNNSRCLKNEGSFELCKENFCYLTQQDCAGLILPQYGDFYEKDL